MVLHLKGRDDNYGIDSDYYDDDDGYNDNHHHHVDVDDDKLLGRNLLALTL